jgi:glycosyltransferase involved in cell wall biosynthesis
MVSDSILDQIKESKQLHQSLTYLDYLPHKEVFEQYQSASVLLLLLNRSENAKWILPGKMYEYMFTGKPILTLGDTESDVQDLLKECDAGEVFDFDDKEKIKSFLILAYQDFKKGKLTVKSDKVSLYTRRSLTEKLSNFMTLTVES